MLPPVEGGPRDLARVLALQEQRLGLAVLEAEDLAVTTDVELALCLPSALFCTCRCVSAACLQAFNGAWPSCLPVPHVPRVRAVRGNFDMGWGGQLGRARGGTHLARVDLLAGEGVVVGTHVGGVGGYLGLVGVRTSRCSTICAGSQLPWAFGRTISRVLTQRTITKPWNSQHLHRL